MYVSELFKRWADLVDFQCSQVIITRLSVLIWLAFRCPIPGCMCPYLCHAALTDTEQTLNIVLFF